MAETRSGDTSRHLPSQPSAPRRHIDHPNTAPNTAPGYAAESVESIRAAYERQDRAIPAPARIGSKVALTNAAAMARFGARAPCRGWLTEEMRVPSAGEAPACPGGPARIELEIAFRMDVDIRPGAEFGEETLVSAIREVIPAIEIVRSRVPGGPTTLAELVCDNSSASQFVLGSAVPLPPGFDFVRVSGTVERNAEQVGEGSGSDVLGSPLTSLAWLVGSLGGSGHVLHAGDLVLTGSMTPAFVASAGDSITGRIEGLGDVSVHFGEKA